MPRACSTCARPDAKLLEDAFRNGESAKSIAKRTGIGHRTLCQHFARHCGNIRKRLRASQAGHRALQAIRDEVDAEARLGAFLQRLERLADSVEQWIEESPRDKDAHATMQGYLKEIRNTAETIAKIRGELNSNPTINLHDAKMAITVTTAVANLTDRQVAARALQVVRMWQDLHPNDLLEIEGDDPTPGVLLESRSTDSDVDRESSVVEVLETES